MDDLLDLFENANVCMRRVGADGTILWANQAELDLFGYRSEDYVGQKVIKLHVNPALVGELIDRLQRNEVIENCEAELFCKDGSIKQVLINSSPVMVDGKLAYTRCFTTQQ